MDKDKAVGLRWLAEGKEDPFPDLVGKKRESLMMKELSDDELANMQYMYQGAGPDVLMNVMMSGGKSHIAVVTAVKERLRWLSRRVAELEGSLHPVEEEHY